MCSHNLEIIHNFRENAHICEWLIVYKWNYFKKIVNWIDAIKLSPRSILNTFTIQISCRYAIKYGHDLERVQRVNCTCSTNGRSRSHKIYFFVLFLIKANFLFHVYCCVPLKTRKQLHEVFFLSNYKKFLYYFLYGLVGLWMENSSWKDMLGIK